MPRRTDYSALFVPRSPHDDDDDDDTFVLVFPPFPPPLRFFARPTKCLPAEIFSRGKNKREGISFLFPPFLPLLFILPPSLSLANFLILRF